MEKLFVVGLILACSGCIPMQQKPEASLYNRIGGKPMLTRLSNQTLDIVSKDPRTSHSFEGVKMSTLKQSLADFLCVKTGGDCIYEGETMKNAHKESQISMAEYEVMVDVLRQQMDQNGVGTREKNQLLKILAPMKRDVVTR